jgi:hypothetical protein
LNDGAVKRKTGKGNKVEIPCPQAIINYSKYMGGVDISDQKREYYELGRSSKKWSNFIFHFVINVCVVNSFILYDLNTHWIGGWVGPRAGVDDMEKRKFLTLLGLKLQPLICPALSQLLY